MQRGQFCKMHVGQGRVTRLTGEANRCESICTIPAPICAASRRGIVRVQGSIEAPKSTRLDYSSLWLVAGDRWRCLTMREVCSEEVASRLRRKGRRLVRCSRRKGIKEDSNRWLNRWKCTYGLTVYFSLLQIALHTCNSTARLPFHAR
jgi:hypothetical protein